MIHRQLYPTLYGILLTIPLAACGGPDSNGIGEDAGASSPDNAAVAEPQDPALVEAAEAAAELARGKSESKAAEGAITATINGESRTWYITNESNLTDWESLEDDGTNVTLVGYTNLSDRTWKEAMELGFEIRKSDGGFSVSNSLVTYYSYGATRHHSTGRQRESSVIVTHVEIDGNSIELSGAFSDALRYKDWGGGSSDDDANDDITIDDGAFHALLTRK